MKRRRQIFSLLEEFTKSKYPKFIKQILIENAFDSEAALKTIEKSSVDKIEKIINENTDLVKDTVYVNNDGSLKKSPFKFLLGHEALILNIPLDLEKYLQSKSKKKNTTPDIINLKVLLEKKIKKYIESKGLDLTIQSDDFTSFSVSDNVVKCLARCPICSIKVPCAYDSSWKNSNYCKHIVHCFDKKAKKKPDQNITAEIPREIQRANNGNSVSNIISEVKNVAK